MAAIGVAAGRSAAIAGKPAPTKAAPTKKGRDCSRPFQALGRGGVAAGSAIACRSGLGRDRRRCRAMRCHRGQARSHKARSHKSRAHKKRAGLLPPFSSRGPGRRCRRLRHRVWERPWPRLASVQGDALPLRVGAALAAIGVSAGRCAAIACRSGLGRDWRRCRAKRCHRGQARSHKARSHKARSHKGSAHKKRAGLLPPFSSLGPGPALPPAPVPRSSHYGVQRCGRVAS